TDQRITHRYLHDSSSALDLGSLRYLLEGPENHDTDTVLTEIRRDAQHRLPGDGIVDSLELHELIEQNTLESIHVRDTVTNVDNCADIGGSRTLTEVFDLLPNNLFDLVYTDRHVSLPI